MSGSGSWSFSSTRLNLAGFKELRKSPAAEAMVMDAAEKIARAASATSGEEYEAKQSPGRNRARAVVAPATPEAAVDSATNFTLLKSMNAGRS